MIEFDVTGSTDKTQAFLNNMTHLNADIKSIMNSAGAAGVAALAGATPVESGLTAASWSYEVVEEGGSIYIYWKNTNVVNGVNIAIILQYGHGTGTGGWVSGRDYINPSIQSTFDRIAADVWKKVTSS